MICWDPVPACRRYYRQHGFIFPALYYAAFAGLEEVCDWLLKKGADLAVGPDGRDWQWTKSVEETKQGCTLHAAVLGNVEWLAVLLIQDYPDMIEAPDGWNFTPVMLAIILSNKRLVEKLVESGANLEDERTLEWAAAGGRIDLVEFLIERGANTYKKATSTCHS